MDPSRLSHRSVRYVHYTALEVAMRPCSHRGVPWGRQGERHRGTLSSNRLIPLHTRLVPGTNSTIRYSDDVRLASHHLWIRLHDHHDRRRHTVQIDGPMR